MAPRKKTTKKRNEKGFVNAFISQFRPWTNKELKDTFEPLIDLQTTKDTNRVSINIDPETLSKNLFSDERDKDKDKSSIYHSLEGTSKNLKSSVQESITNEKILEYFPDVDAAKGIIIDSILSPNNLKRESMTIVVEKKSITDDNIITKITEILNKYFIEEMKLNDKLEMWLEKAIYIDGAVGLASIPVSAENIIDDMKVSLESKEKYIVNDSAFGISEDFTNMSSKQFEEQYMSIENNRINFIKETEKTQEVIQKSKFDKKQSYAPLVEVIDNPDILFLSEEKKKENKKQMKEKMKNFYKDNILFINESEVNKKTTLLNLEIDKCAIIPIHTPGSNKIEYSGFFIILNDNNMPIKKDEINNTMELTHTPGVFDDIFKSYNINDLQNYSNLSNIKPEDIYKDILLEYINQGLSVKDLGYISKDIDSVICKYLFFNNLKKKKIKFLYLPSEFLTYFAFHYDKNNMGISILSKLKTSLEQYMTIKICNILAALDNAISKKIITVRAQDEKLLSHINHLPKFLDDIKEAYVNKNTPKFSISPDSISSSAVKSSLSVKVEGMQGSFDITSENVSSQNNLVDNELFENSRREVITGLGIPPSAINALGEHEYSRSVAGSSILFANKIEKEQMTTITHTSKHVQNIVRFDKNLLKQIRNIVNDIPIESIIEDIKVHLPKPHVVYNEGDSNIIRGVIDIAENLANKYIPDDLSAINDKLSDRVNLIKAFFIKHYTETKLEEMGMPINIDLFDIPTLQDYIQELINLSHGIGTKVKSDETQPTSLPPSSGDNFNEPPPTNTPPVEEQPLPGTETPPVDDTTGIPPTDTTIPPTTTPPVDETTEPPGGPDDNFRL